MQLAFELQMFGPGGEVVEHSHGHWNNPVDALSDVFVLAQKVLRQFGFDVDVHAGLGAMDKARHREPWTDEEIERAQKWRDEGMSFDLIARRLGRTAAAVQKKLSRV